MYTSAAPLTYCAWLATRPGGWFWVWSDILSKVDLEIGGVKLFGFYVSLCLLVVLKCLGYGSITFI